MNNELINDFTNPEFQTESLISRYQNDSMKCIEHQWIRANHHIPTIMKYGSLSRGMWICKVCGKLRVF